MTPSNYAGLGAAMTADLLIDLRFGTGVILAVKMVNVLDYCIKEETEVTDNKMTEQVQQVSVNNTKKVEQGKRLAENNRRKREHMKAQKSESETKLTYYGAGTTAAIGVSGIIDYFV